MGVLLVGRRFGWKELLILDDRKTFEKYQQILGVRFREVHAEVGHLASKSMGWRVAQRFGRFWALVRGDAPGACSPEIAEAE